MADLFETTVVCDKCNRKTNKNQLFRNGFKIRVWECPNCGKIWEHPADKQVQEDFKKLKEKEFQVKLRMVGNSYAVSIPKEIINFEEEFNRELNELISLSIEEPGKISLFLHKKMARMFKTKENQEEENERSKRY
jgi:ribosomal protein L37AE/L43A